MLGRRSPHGLPRYRAVEGHESTAVGDGEGQKVGIRNLPRAEQVGRIHHGRIEEAHVVVPELVMLGTGRTTEPPDGVRNGGRIGIAGLTEDSHASVLSQGTGSPPRIDIALEPVASAPGDWSAPASGAG